MAFVFSSHTKAGPQQRGESHLHPSVRIFKWATARPPLEALARLLSSTSADSILPGRAAPPFKLQS
ncbi:uncharacterized protein CTRU02_205378 [Colletotrichum truncatum]|uniref:Uncharacterized protein n=1 Tax=Colletotrichum truncatum TaxID=5467 RepID=A0ACC3Z3T5_COLTU